MRTGLHAFESQRPRESPCRLYTAENQSPCCIRPSNTSLQRRGPALMACRFAASYRPCAGAPASMERLRLSTFPMGDCCFHSKVGRQSDRSKARKRQLRRLESWVPRSWRATSRVRRPERNCQFDFLWRRPLPFRCTTKSYADRDETAWLMNALFATAAPICFRRFSAVGPHVTLTNSPLSNSPAERRPRCART
jgi:hypothetical protein